MLSSERLLVLYPDEKILVIPYQSIDRVAPHYRAALTAAVADLPSRITCNPPAPPPASHDNGRGKDHGKHKGQEGGEG